MNATTHKEHDLKRPRYRYADPVALPQRRENLDLKKIKNVSIPNINKKQKIPAIYSRGTPPKTP